MSYYGADLPLYITNDPRTLPILCLPRQAEGPLDSCYLHQLHRQQTGSSISLNRPRHHLHPATAPTIINMIVLNNIQNQLDQNKNIQSILKKRKVDEMLDRAWKN